MNWIRLSSEFPRHRKTLRLIRRLGKVARTYPVMLWLWAVEQSSDGSLRDIDANELAVICDHEGDPKELWAAMADCGFIERAGKGWRIRSWDEHQGKLIERNERNAERMRRARAQHVRGTCEAMDETDGTNETNERDERKPAAVAPEDAPEAEAEFDSLWAICAKKVAKGAAKRTYMRLRRSGSIPPLADVTAKLIALQECEAWTKDGREYQPHLATWLNREGWLDEIPKRSDKLAWIRAGGPTSEQPDSGPSIAERLAALADSIPDTAPRAARLRAEIVGLSGSFETVEARLEQIESEALAELESRLANQHIASIEKAVAAVPKGAAAEVRASLIRQRARKLTGIPHLSLVSDAAIPRRKSA